MVQKKSFLGEILYYQGNPKGYHYTVISAITKEKKLGFQIFQGSVQHNDLEVFIIKLLD